MHGPELQEARNNLMRELRRAAVGELPPGLALDGEHLFDLIASGATHNRGILLQRTLVLRGLRGAGFGADYIARRFGLSPAQLVHELERPLVVDPSIVDAIADRVLAELVETPEPGRAQPPAGDFAVPGMSYPPDPKFERA